MDRISQNFAYCAIPNEKIISQLGFFFHVLKPFHWIVWLLLTVAFISPNFSAIRRSAFNFRRMLFKSSVDTNIEPAAFRWTFARTWFLLGLVVSNSYLWIFNDSTCSSSATPNTTNFRRSLPGKFYASVSFTKGQESWNSVG